MQMFDVQQSLITYTFINYFPEVFAHLTHPVAAQASACALSLYSPEEGKVTEFGKHQ